MTEVEVIESTEDLIAKRKKDMLEWWFPEHEVTHFCEHDHMSHMRWQKPGTCVYQVDYYVTGQRLMVTGDIGAAVYCWSSPVTFHWLAGLNLGYFAEKCMASEVGRSFVEWDERIAKVYLDWQIKNDFEEIQDSYAEKATKWMEDLQNANPWRYIHSQYEWSEWLNDFGNEFFGDEYYEHHGIGNIVNMRCQGHLLGLHLAQEWRAKEAGNA